LTESLAQGPSIVLPKNDLLSKNDLLPQGKGIPPRDGDSPVQKPMGMGQAMGEKVDTFLFLMSFSIVLMFYFYYPSILKKSLMV
jgi:hypothetical protein